MLLRVFYYKSMTYLILIHLCVLLHLMTSGGCYIVFRFWLIYSARRK